MLQGFWIFASVVFNAVAFKRNCMQYIFLVLVSVILRDTDNYFKLDTPMYYSRLYCETLGQRISCLYYCEVNSAVVWRVCIAKFECAAFPATSSLIDIDRIDLNFVFADTCTHHKLLKIASKSFGNFYFSFYVNDLCSAGEIHAYDNQQTHCCDCDSHVFVCFQ